MKKTLFTLLLAVIAVAFSACNKSTPEDEPKIIGQFRFAPVMPADADLSDEDIAKMSVRIMSKSNPTWEITGTYSKFEQPLKAVVDTYTLEMVSEAVSRDEVNKTFKAYYGVSTFSVLQDKTIDVPVQMELKDFVIIDI
ncbi:MAG: DUF4493 domain-containing protein [Muribaculaceae bacterium]|nr:DUF4493 domain-containing protein [Muribaculaceae bacterium]